MYLRVLWHTLLSRRGSRISIWDVARTAFRVLPADLDIYRHVNNGRYLSIMDLGRLDWMLRTGLSPEFERRGWYPVVAASSIAYRRSLTLWQRFSVETKFIGVDARAFYVEQRFVRGGQVYATGIVRGRMLSRAGGIVTNEELFSVTGEPPADLVLPDWIARWAADSALPPSKADAPSEW